MAGGELLEMFAS